MNNTANLAKEIQPDEQVLEVEIRKIILRLFVRENLDQDRVQYFVTLYRAGAKLPPLILDLNTWDMIEGRHRFAAQQHLGWKMSHVIFRPYADDNERIAAAMVANAQGALPQTEDDIKHTIELLMHNKLKKDAIANLVANSLGIPKQAVQTLVKQVMERIRNRNLRAAITDVIHNHLNVDEAAKKHTVCPDKLRGALSDNSESGQSKYNDEKLKVQNTLKGAIRSIGARMTHIQQLLVSGEITGDEAMDLVRCNQGLVEAMLKNAEQWVTRFEQSTGVVKATAKDVAKKKTANTSVLASPTPGKPSAALAALKLMGLDTGTPASKKLSPEQFALRAIETLAEVPTKRNLPGRGRVIHTVYSKFNLAFRIYFDGHDPVQAVRVLELNRKISMKLAGGGAVISKPGVLVDAPKKEFVGPPPLSKSVSRLDQLRLGRQ